MAFFGRSGELADLLAWVSRSDPDSRLVTITGPPGIGKTRFATELVRRLPEERRAIVCALEDVRDPSAAGDALASAAGASSRDEAIAGIAQSPEPIVVLDGGDAVLDTVRDMARAILDGVDGIVIVTSRTRLGLPGERIVDLGSLDPDAAQGMLSEAISLRGAAIPDRDRPLVVELAAELEGIPLALELAAARVPVMGLRPLLHRLRSRSKDVLHGLETAIDGSWQSAEEHERSALAQTTVFSGGFTLEAAEAILELPGKSIPDVLDALLGRSLLRRAPDGRLSLYRPIHDFASSKLDPALRARVRQRHVDWYAARAVNADRAWLAAESENVLSVIASVLESGPVTPRRAEPALRLLVSALPVLVGSAPLDAFDALLDPVLQATKASGVDAILLVRVMAARGILRRHRGQAREGAEDLVRALSAIRTHGSSPAIEADLLRELGYALLEARQPAEAKQHFEQSLELATDAAVQARALAGEALVLHQLLDLDQAGALLERAIVMQPGIASDLHALAAIRVDQARHAEARTLLEQCTSAEGVGTTFGLLALDEGDLDRARALLEASAATFGDRGATRARAAALAIFGIASHASGRSAEAWALLSQAMPMLGTSALGIVCGAHLAVLDARAGRSTQSHALLGRLASAADPNVVPVAAHVIALVHGDAPPDSAVRSSALLRATQRCLGQSHAPPPAEDALVLATDGTWFRIPGGVRVPLDRRRPLARMLAAMGQAPNQSFTSAKLLAAGWPSERVIAEAGAHRVRVGIATLRKLGLRDAIKTTEDGYTLVAPKLVVV